MLVTQSGMIAAVARACTLVFVAAIAGCLSDPAYVCSADAQCVSDGAGQCQPNNFCAYDEPACPSGLIYGPHAAASLADTCVEPGGDTNAADDGVDSEGADSDETGDEPPVTRCGNGVVEPGEICDDGNRSGGDDCHPQCIEPGSPAWTVTYDGEAHGEDRGFALAIDADANAIYVTGITTVDGMDRDILVQRRRLETGSLIWTRAIDGGILADDMGEHVAVDSEGNVVVVGVVTTTLGTDVWLTKYDPDGTVLWSATHDAAGGNDKGNGVAVLSDDSIIAVGIAQADDRTDAWMQRYSADGAPIGEELRRGEVGSNHAIDVIADGMAFQVTGSLNRADGTPSVWTARYDQTNTLQWEHLLDNDNVGNLPRGVGQALNPLGGSSTAGVLSNNLLVQHYDGSGAPLTMIAIDGPRQMHDEAADVDYSTDGSFVVAGFLDFATEGFATSDSYVARYSAQGEPLWSDRFEGEAKEIDKALGVQITVQQSAVVVGYETVPGQSRDMWLRRYAL